MTIYQSFWLGFGACLFIVSVFGLSIWTLRRCGKRKGVAHPPRDYAVDDSRINP